jgi:hypothetical protein
MTYVKSLFGALAIMMASGMILDFEFVESDSETYIRVWSPADGDSTYLRKHVGTILSPHIDERHVLVVSEDRARVS